GIECRKLQQRAQNYLAGRDEVHSLLVEAFNFRINQALEGKPIGGSLPPEQLEYLGQMERDPRYVVDRLRQRSHILEPHEEIEPYRHYHMRVLDELGRTLATLPDVIERQELANQLNRLLQETRKKDEKGTARRVRVLATALDLAPRIGEG